MKSLDSDKSGLRQILSVSLVVFGGVLMMMAPETWSGVLFMALGIFIEIIAVSINHRNHQDSPK